MFDFINGYAKGFDFKNVDENFEEGFYINYQIAVPGHGGKVMVCGDEALRDRILAFLQKGD